MKFAGWLNKSSLMANIMFALIPILYLMALFAAELVGKGNVVLGAPGTDMFLQFLNQREFISNEFAKGNFPFWNPYIFSGIPALGNIQFALCYPLNILYLIFPVAPATNMLILIHLALAGFFMGKWIRSLGMEVRVALTAGIIYMGCGSLYSHVYAGHLTMISLFSWAPLLFHSIDDVIKGGKSLPIISGVAALGLMILAGYPQFVFHIGLAAALYSLIRIFECRNKLKTIILLALIPFLAAALSAFQLAATMQVRDESVRGGKLSFEYASLFALPPENLITLVSPFSLGNQISYWGRAYLWEMELFIGVTAIVFAIVALFRKEIPARRGILILIIILFILALGKNTPLFAVLFDYAPGFGSFRGHSKWAFPASIFLVLLSSYGFQSFINDPLKPKYLPHITIFLSGILFLGSLYCTLGMGAEIPSIWKSFLEYLANSNESYKPVEYFFEPFIQRTTLVMFCKSVLNVSISMAIVSLIILVARKKRIIANLILLSAIIEIFIFNNSYLATFPVENATVPQINSSIADSRNDYRVSISGQPNSSMSSGVFGIWGYDPFAPKRYTEFIAFTQGLPLNTPAEDININRWHPLFSLLRYRFQITPGYNGSIRTDGPFPHLPEALLLSEYQVVNGAAEEILSAMTKSDFNPAKKVLLEKVPAVSPQSSAYSGKVQVFRKSTDELHIDAVVNSPSILLLTDPFSSGWRAEGSPQKSYPILKADYILQAIPLSAGHHSIKMIYEPPALSVWGGVSIATAIMLLIAGVRQLLMNKTETVRG